MQKSDMIGGLR